MVNAKSKALLPAVTPDCPAVVLARNLLFLWEADEGAQIEFSDRNDSYPGSDTSQQINDWMKALVAVISFTRAKSLDGALVQISLALETFDDIANLSEDDKGATHALSLQLNRLMHSAMRAIGDAIGSEVDPSVSELVRIYGGKHELWIQQAASLAEKGRACREEA